MASVFKRSSDSDRNIASSLYFGNLDPQVTELLLYELFVQFAPIRSLNLPKDRLLKTHQGFGFVEFKNTEDAEYTLDILRGVRLYGKTLKLKKAELNRSMRQQQVGVTGNSSATSIDTNSVDVGAKLFINNLNPLIDEQFLEDTFSKFGKLIKPTFIARNEAGDSKGYGFVKFDDFDVSDTVIEKMNGVILMNSKISVSYAFKEDPNTHNKRNAKHGDRVDRLLAENAKSNKVAAKDGIKKNNWKINGSKKANRVTKPNFKRDR